MPLAWLLALLSLALTGCGPRAYLAPVSEITWRQHHTTSLYHRVRPGETLYSVAFRYDQDYRQLAQYNHLRPPYGIRVGQILRLSSQGQRTVYTPHQPHYPYYQSRVSKAVHWGHDTPRPAFSPKSAVGFIWPAQGRVLSRFSPQRGQKGIDIVGRAGVPVRAAAPGIVAYAGNGLIGYGNLIIIKHNLQYLTAYGYLENAYVKEGQSVRAGQVVGGMGRVDRRFSGIHFEIRHAGKPVNPLIYLKK